MNSYCSFFLGLEGAILRNSNSPRTKVKSPINKEEITFTWCQGLALLQDWCSHIKSAPWKVLPQWTDAGHIWIFFLLLSLPLCLTSRAHWRCIRKRLILGLVFVCRFSGVFCRLRLMIALPPSLFLSPSLIPLLAATGFVVHFLLSEPSFKGARLPSDRRWGEQMRNDLHTLAPLHFRSPYYCHYQARARGRTRVRAANFTHFARWLGNTSWEQTRSNLAQ